MKWILPEGSFVGEDGKSVSIQVVKWEKLCFRLDDKCLVVHHGCGYDFDHKTVGTKLIVHCTYVASAGGGAALGIVKIPVPSKIETIEFTTEYVGPRVLPTGELVFGREVRPARRGFGAFLECLGM